jgi:hypothetical protein
MKNQRPYMYVYAKLLDETGAPITVLKMPAVYKIAQQAQSGFPTDWAFGHKVRVVGHVPDGFEYCPDIQNCYKVELDPPDARVQKWLKQSMDLPSCSIDTITLQLEDSVSI